MQTAAGTPVLRRLPPMLFSNGGAARFGRRTVGPHARSAAPVQLHHEDSRHEAAMVNGANASVKDGPPEWVNSTCLRLRDEAYCLASIPGITEALRRRYPHKVSYQVAVERIVLDLAVAIAAANSGSLVATLDIVAFCHDSKLPLPPSTSDQVVGDLAQSYTSAPVPRIGHQTVKEMELRIRSAWMNRILFDYDDKKNEVALFAKMELQARSVLRTNLRGHFERLFGQDNDAGVAGGLQSALTPEKIEHALTDDAVKRDLSPSVIEALRRDQRLKIPDFAKVRESQAEWQTIEAFEWRFVARRFVREADDYLRQMASVAAELKAEATELRGAINFAEGSPEADRASRCGREAAELEDKERRCRAFLLANPDPAAESYRRNADDVVHLARHMNRVETWSDLHKGRVWPGRYYLPRKETLAACGLDHLAEIITAAGLTDDAPRLFMV